VGLRPRPAVLCSRRCSLAASNRRQRPFMKTLSTIFFSLIAILALFVSVFFTFWAFSSAVANDQDRHFFMGLALVALLIAIASQWKIYVLNRQTRRVREPDSLLPPYSTVPPVPEGGPGQSASTPSSDGPRASRPGVASTYLPPAPIQSRVLPSVVKHLSPASQSAIQQLALVLAAKIAAEVVLGLVGWYVALGSPRTPFALLNFGFLAWGLAAIAPDLVLLYSLTRRPGPSAFAYSLVIPTLHILFGLTGHSALLFLIPHSGQAAIPLLSIIPWILDILVPYLTWKAIRFTGIRPDPTRLTTAFVVILIYRILLPALFVLLN
jgi:hypothetical protein